MSTATMQQPFRGYPVMNNSRVALRPELQEVVKNILALRAFAREDGHFKTHKSQRELLARLNASDLATVTRAIAEAEGCSF